LQTTSYGQIQKTTNGFFEWFVLQYKTMTRLTRTLALFVCVLSLALGTVQSVSAAVSQADLQNYSRKSDVEYNVAKTLDAVVKSENEGIPSNESFVDSNLGNLQTSGFLFLAGPPESIVASLTEEEKRIVYQRYGRGVIPEISNAITALYHPPASSQTYLADVLESANIIPQAQAQGLGFSALDPVLNVWKIFRNVAYLFFVIVFLIIGFMIMFRQKISGQTVVTAQQAIPGVIVALIFVTFSYAIAGFLIDLMYLLMYLMIGLFQPVGGTEWISKNIFIAARDIVFGVGDNLSAATTVNQAVQGFVGSIVNPLEGAIADVLGWIGGITVALIVSVAILIATFKIFFELIKTYVTIVLSIATSPLMLMLGAIPGRNNLAQWLKLIAGNLMAFPTVLMAFIIYDMFSRNDFSTGGFLPPYLIGQGQGGVVVTLVGIGLLLIIPELIKQVKKAMGAEGGLWEQLGGDILRNVKSDGLRYAVPGAYIGGGLARDVYTGARDNRGGGLEAMLSGVYSNIRTNLPERARRGNEAARALENLIEGKFLDPNSIEAILQKNLVSEQKKRAGEQRKAREETQATPTG
jgi:hypothetical protein